MRSTNEAIGGRAALDAAVERFHERVAADPELAGYFDGMDIRRILERQLALFALVAAGQRNV
jgi:hemoglobin